MALAEDIDFVLGQIIAGAESGHYGEYILESEHQGKCHGTNMINLFLSICPAEATLYVRCYPTSKIMYSLLLNTGFKLLNTKPGGTRELEFKKT